MFQNSEYVGINGARRATASNSAAPLLRSVKHEVVIDKSDAAKKEKRRKAQDAIKQSDEAMIEFGSIDNFRQRYARLENNINATTANLDAEVDLITMIVAALDEKVSKESDMLREILSYAKPVFEQFKIPPKQTNEELYQNAINKLSKAICHGHKWYSFFRGPVKEEGSGAQALFTNILYAASKHFFVQPARRYTDKEQLKVEVEKATKYALDSAKMPRSLKYVKG